MQQTHINQQSSLKNFRTRCILFLLTAVFISPFLLGSLLYFYRDQFNFTSNAKGEILKPCLAKTVLDIPMEEFLGRWQILYLSPSNCDQNCILKTQMLQNLCIALGKDQERVVLRTIASSNIESHALPQASLTQAFTVDSVMIIDPQGWLVTHYKPHHFHAKELLEDLRRLLRYSYVG